MTVLTAHRPSPDAVPEDLRLETGMTMSLAEFRRRSAQRPDLRRVELIQGVVHAPDDTRVDYHGRPQFLILAWLAAYEELEPGAMALSPVSVDLGGNSQPEPDALLVWRDPVRATTRVNELGHVEGAPELVIEVSGTSQWLDLGSKFEAYQAAGVKEYLVWLTRAREIRWHVFVDGRYERITPNQHGILTSREFPNLRLDVLKLLDGDRAGVITTLMQVRRDD